MNISCATKSMIRSNRSLQGFRPYDGKLSREDVATLVEVFDFAKHYITSDMISGVLRDSNGFFLFELVEEGNTDFDFYEYINQRYGNNVTVSPLNALAMFPRALSKGVYSKFIESGQSDDKDEEEEETPTGYMDEDMLGDLNTVEYYLTYTRTGEEVVFSNKETKIGRSAKTADFVTKVSINVSRPHCTIYMEGLDPMVRDENSANGTYINGKRIPSGRGCRLEVGDSLVLADEEFTVNSR